MKSPLTKLFAQTNTNEDKRFHMTNKYSSMKFYFIFKITVLIFVLIQFIRPEKNVINPKLTTNLNNEVNTTLVVQEILSSSCFDCHSNNTNYRWYHNMAPISWIVANHVNEGKNHLNFSEWGKYNKNQKKHILDEIEEVIKKNEMPLKSYLLIHHEKKITNQHKQYLLEWIEYEKLKNN